MNIPKIGKSAIPRRRPHEQGTAVIVVIALFAIMLLFLGMSLRGLNYLRQDLKLIEQQQLRRIRQAPVAYNTAWTNAPSTNSSPRINPL